MTKTKVHVIPHSHWDREWYFTSSRSTVYLIKHMKEVLSTLEEKEGFPFYLMDAQTSLIEDYLKYCPEDEDRIKTLVSQKRLLTGPWYTQTDQLVISQESVVRNLLYGTRFSDQLGHTFKMGYVPDAFGQGANMPQIYKSFGIERFLFWRGVADNRLKQTEFVWKGSDGTQVLAVQMPFGYYYGGNIPEDINDTKAYLTTMIGALEEKASTKHVYFPNGFDQAPVRKNLPELVETFNQMDEDRSYVMNSPEVFFDEVEADASELPVITGELTEGKHSRIHKSIFSTRADLKQKNNQIENYLTNCVEPILTISHSLGNAYPHKQLEEIWKLMFENAAHDSIGGCNSDETNQDVTFRYKLANDKAKNLLDLHMRLISERIPYQQDLNFTLFNPLPYQRSGTFNITLYIPDEAFTIKDTDGQVIPYTILDKADVTEYVLNQTIQLNPSKDIYLPKKIYLANLLISVQNTSGLGYTSYYLDLDKEAPKQELLVSFNRAIENDFYKVSLADNNTLTITDKRSGSTFTNQMLFVENGDDGDSYNYSPPRDDLFITSKESECLSVKRETGELEERLTIKLKMLVPYDLKDRAAGINDQPFIIEAQVSLRKDEEWLRFNAKVNNQVLSHRLTVQFDTKLASHFSTADQLFGVINRPVRLPEMDVWEKEAWHETPISIEPMQSFVALHQEEQTVAVLTEGVREYEIVGEQYDTIQLTLFRTFSHMGKTDLLYRPGRASGETIVETPDAQLLGELSSSFALVYKGCSFDESHIAKLAKSYLSPMQAYQFSDFLNGRLIYAFRDEEKTNPLTYQLADFNDMTAVVSAIKKTEDSDHYLVRVFNPYLNQVATVSQHLVDHGQFVQLDEQTADQLVAQLTSNQFKSIILSS
ncbi:mannosylglycerate hydrolase [Amphibacillus cookii]|uniref:mannosylglycerate hydrolase n=1 Tax=Amphibacillus cookii TaxID=767787 RepID=UPI001959214B|nr:mannosylglycerate hydrolase [Amphibacillus cookii]MBM7541010.1 mannosylglycerate hydrolase [Amphibacillus cookii]